MGKSEILKIEIALARIEEKLQNVIDQKKEEKEETKVHRKGCSDRLNEIETYIDDKKGADKAKGESALSKSAFAMMTDLARTVIMVITIMIAMKLLHF